MFIMVTLWYSNMTTLGILILMGKRDKSSNAEGFSRQLIELVVFCFDMCVISRVFVCVIQRLPNCTPEWQFFDW